MATGATNQRIWEAGGEPTAVATLYSIILAPHLYESTMSRRGLTATYATRTEYNAGNDFT